MKHAVNVQPEDRRTDRLGRRLVNWGYWCNYDAEIGPEYPKCNSIESTHVAEVGDTTDDDRQCESPVPDIDDAVVMNKLIQKLSPIEQFVLVKTYPGAPAVMKWKRLGDFQFRLALDSAFTKLQVLTQNGRQG